MLMKKRLLLCSILLSAASLPSMAQVTAPVADVLDVQFQPDGTAIDVSPMKNKVEYIGDGTLIDNNSYFGCNVPVFDNPWAGNCTGYYRFDFEGNEDVLAKLADGHSLEMLVKPSYEGDIQDVEAKPFSAMQSGGTGFLVCKTTAAGSGGKNVFTFLPNVSTNGKSTWRWTTSGIVPRSGIYYHVIGVWNKDEQKAYIYVDGQLCNTVDAPGNYFPATAGSNWFCIGGDANKSGGHQAWTGEVVIARVYDKALDAEEADALWKLVEKPEKEANAAAYMEVVSAGRTFIEDNVATQSLTDEYAAALDSLESAVTGSSTYQELDERLMAVMALRKQMDASVTAYTRYQERVDATIAYLAENDDFEGDDRDSLEAYLNDFIEPMKGYPHGSFSYIWTNRQLTTEEVTEEAAWVERKLATAIANGFKRGSDITNLLTNAGFENGFTGWKGTTGSATAKSPTTDFIGAEAKGKKFDMYQKITGLTNGVYVITATAAYRPFDDRYSTYYAANMYANENSVFLPTVFETRIPVADAEDGVNCYITQNGSDADVDLEIADDGSADITSYAINGKVGIANAANGGRAVSCLVANVTDSTLVVGFSNPNAQAASDWTGIANIHLIYAGTLDDAKLYLDQTLACMAARATTIINMVPDLGNVDQNPNCSQTIKDKLQAAVDAVATTTSPEDKYALIGTFSELWKEFDEGRKAYQKMISETETVYSIVSELHAAGKVTDELDGQATQAISDMWNAYEQGSYTTEQANAMEALASLGLITAQDEDGTYLIKSDYDMAYFALKANSQTVHVNGKLLADIDYFTEMQMIEDFCGELDGQFHTITVNINRNDRGAALINNMRDGGCVKNLTVQGDVQNSNKFATAIVANTYGQTRISGITSLIHVTATTPGDAAHAGIMSCSRGTTTVSDCVFAGIMEGEGPINSSGIVGWTAGITVIENCLQIGNISLSEEGSYTIARVPLLVDIYNCYYKNAFGVEQGTQITDEQLANGEVCYLLNKGNTDNPTWFQTIGEDLYPVPNPSHGIVGKKADGTYTNNASEFYKETPAPDDGTPKADLLDVVFNEDGTADDASPMHNDIALVGEETSSVYFSETYQRNVAHFDNPYGSSCNSFYQVASYENNDAIRNALSDGHSFEVLCMTNFEGDIPNVESKPFSAMQGGGTGFLICTKSTTRENELTYLPNITTSGSSTWRWTTSGVVPESKKFYHVVGVWNKEEHKTYIYINGELKNTVDAPGLFKYATTGCNWFAIGGDPSNATTANASWNGDIAIARAYDKPLTAEDVATLWSKVQNPDVVQYIFKQPEPVFRGVYDLRGARLQKPQKGINIINGKKVLVK